MDNNPRISVGWDRKEDAEMELGKRLKEYRARAGMTQDELAEKLDEYPADQPVMVEVTKKTVVILERK